MLTVLYSKLRCKITKMASNPQRKRTVFTNDQKEKLEELYAAGMQWKGSKCLHQINNAVSLTGLSENIVKEWIGNRRKKDFNQTERPQKDAKHYYTKGISSYNAFVHDNKEELGNMGSAWSAAWNAKTHIEKNAYKQRAIELTSTRVDQKKAKTHLLSNIDRNISELANMGVSLVCMGMDSTDGTQIRLGSGVANEFLNQNEKILDSMHSFCDARSDLSAKDSEKRDAKTLSRRATEHMNMLYAKAVGKNKAFPYRKVFDGELEIHGLPKEILPLSFLSHYGKKKLEAILECKSIEVIQQLEQPGSSNGQPLNIDTGEPVREEEHLDISYGSDLSAKDSEKRDAKTLSRRATESNSSDIISSSNRQQLEQPGSSNGQPLNIDTGEPVREEEHLDISYEVTEAVELAEVTKMAEIAEASEDVGLSELSEEDVEVLTPLFTDLQPVKGKKKGMKKKKHEQYFIERIVEEKQIKGKRHFLVKWLGFPEKDNTWEPKRNIPKIYWKNKYNKIENIYIT